MGLHRSVFSAIPLFVVYLATLVHVYALSRQRTQEVSTAPPPSAAATCSQDLESGRPSRNPDNPNADPTSGDSSMGRVRHGLFQAWQGLKGFMLAVCSASERPLHFVKVEFPHSQGIYIYMHASHICALWTKLCNASTSSVLELNPFKPGIWLLALNICASTGNRQSTVIA